MTCSGRPEALLDLSLGLLPADEARALEAHAAGCPACRAELASLTATRRAMAALPAEPAPVRGEALLLAAARESAARAKDRRPAWLRPWLAGGTLALAGVAALALVLVRPRGEPSLVERPLQAEAPRSAAEAGDTAAPAAAPPPRADAATSAPPEAKRERAEAAGSEPRGGHVADRLAAGASAGGIRQVAAPTPAAPAAPAAKAGSSEAALAPAPPAPALEAAAAPRPANLAEDRAAPAPGAAPGEAKAAAPAALRAAPAEARAAKAVAGCRLEARRSLDRDPAGRVVARHRSGRYPSAGGADLPLAVDERFEPGGRLRSATVRVGERVVTVSDADIAAGRLEPLPGVVLAADAAEAERALPRCEP